MLICPVRKVTLALEEHAAIIVGLLDGRRDREAVADAASLRIGAPVPDEAVAAVLAEVEHHAMLDLACMRVDDARLRGTTARRALGKLRRMGLLEAARAAPSSFVARAMGALERGDPVSAVRALDAAAAVGAAPALVARARGIVEAAYLGALGSLSPFPRLVFARPERAFRRLAAWLGPIFSSAGLCAGVALLVVAAALVGPQLGTLTAELAKDPAQAVFSLSVGGAMTVLAILVHEIGHGVACTYYGGKVTEAGFALIYGVLPAFYCDVTTLYTIRGRWRRLMVLLAGVFFGYLLAAVAALVWLATAPGTTIHEAARLLFVTSLVMQAPNLIPFIRLDGYYALCLWLGEGNLARDSFSAVRALLDRATRGLGLARVPLAASALTAVAGGIAWVDWVGGGAGLSLLALLVMSLVAAVLVGSGIGRRPARRGAALRLYACGTLLYAVLVAHFLFTAVFERSRAWLGGWGAAVALFFLLAFVRFVRREIVGSERAEAPMLRTALALSGVALGLAGLAAVPAPHWVPARVVVQPAHTFVLRAPFAGRVERLVATDGAQVAGGSLVMRMESTPLELARALARAEVVAATADVSLARRSASPARRAAEVAALDLAHVRARLAHDAVDRMRSRPGSLHVRADVDDASARERVAEQAEQSRMATMDAALDSDVWSIRAAESRRDAALDRLARRQAELDSAEVRSPFTGTADGCDPAWRGRVLAAGDALPCRVSEGVEARLEIEPERALEIEVGAEVALRVISQAEVVWRARVQRVAPAMPGERLEAYARLDPAAALPLSGSSGVAWVRAGEATLLDPLRAAVTTSWARLWRAL